MRLGGYYAADTIDELPRVCEQLDRHGLSAIPAPRRLEAMSDDECVAFGQAARDLGVVIGEAGMWENLMTSDPARRAERIERLRTLLRKAELTGCRSVISLVGSGHPSDSMLAPDATMLGDEGRRAFVEVCLRIVDGLDLHRTAYAIEPWRTSFFYRPEDIRTFLDDVGHPAVRVHLDLANMVGRQDYFDTAGLADRTFALLADRIVGAHLKDLRWDYEYMSLKVDEVPIGDGVIDYGAYLRGLAALDPDLPCFCEHLSTEAEYVESFARLHALAREHGLGFLGRDGPAWEGRA